MSRRTTVFIDKGPNKLSESIDLIIHSQNSHEGMGIIDTMKSYVIRDISVIHSFHAVL